MQASQHNLPMRFSVSVCARESHPAQARRSAIYPVASGSLLISRSRICKWCPSIAYCSLCSAIFTYWTPSVVLLLCPHSSRQHTPRSFAVFYYGDSHDVLSWALRQHQHGLVVQLFDRVLTARLPAARIGIVEYGGYFTSCFARNPGCRGPELQHHIDDGTM